MAATESDGRKHHIGIKQGEVGRYVLLPGDPDRVEVIASRFDNPKFVMRRREYTTWTGELDGVPVACTSTGIGCPSTAIAVEELADVGVDTFIRVGTSGSMQHHIKPGSIGVVSGAIRDEGTSRHYLPMEFPAVADLDITLALREAVRRAASLGTLASRSRRIRSTDSTIPSAYRSPKICSAAGRRGWRAVRSAPRWRLQHSSSLRQRCACAPAALC